MKVKICGVIDPNDARLAADLGADYVGIIFASSSKRCASLALAQKIVAAAREGGAEPVGIFAEQTAEEIASICEACRIETIQLHGKRAKLGYTALKGGYSIIYVIDVERDGTLSPGQVIPTEGILLFDCVGGGSGTSFDWSQLSFPENRECFLAGGLNPTNLSKAIGALHPAGVDVASGVEEPLSIRKDPALVKKFIEKALEAV